MRKPNEDFRPRKRFGQNFLRDEGIIDRILSVVKPKDDEAIVEIGPGRGALTRPLLTQIKHLDVIEIDRDLASLLETEFKGSAKLTLHVKDVLKFDFSQLALSYPQKKLRIIGNLPYNISTPLIFQLLAVCPLIQDMHFMLQKEVVDRMTATPNHKASGRLSVMVQYFCLTEALFLVPPEAFTPAPKVNSAFLRLTPFEKPPFPAKHFETFKEITNIAFQQRRKTLQNSLKSYISARDLESLHIQPERRPETLSLKEFVDISNFIHDNR